jgi:hypothetical protein
MCEYLYSVVWLSRNSQAAYWLLHSSSMSLYLFSSTPVTPICISIMVCSGIYIRTRIVLVCFGKIVQVLSASIIRHWGTRGRSNVSPLCLELLAKACRQNMSTKLAIQPISRTNSSKINFHAHQHSINCVVLYLVGYDDDWCTLAF